MNNKAENYIKFAGLGKLKKVMKGVEHIARWKVTTEKLEFIISSHPEKKVTIMFFNGELDNSYSQCLYKEFEYLRDQKDALKWLVGELKMLEIKEGEEYEIKTIEEYQGIDLQEFVSLENKIFYKKENKK